MERRLIHNSMRCPDGTILTSRHVHDYVSHTDANGDYYSNDGGLSYLHRTANKIPAEDLSLYTDSPFEQIREVLERGGRGISGTEELTYVALKDINTEWLDAIIDYEQRLRPNNPYLEFYRAEKEFRKQ